MQATTAPAAIDGSSSRFAALVELTKPRITRLVTITSAVGFVLAAVGADALLTLDFALAAIGCLIGTALSASGANALNQWMERDRDRVMPRTCARPLPTQKLTPTTAMLAGISFSIAGVAVLLALCGPAAALVSASTIILYLLAYTPLKTVTTVSTIVGAVPGALPPLIGWTAAGTVMAASQATAATAWYAPLLDAGGWSLFLLMFVWQIPHFLAIAWMYRDDYAKGGYRMLSLLDADGARTSRTILTWSLALVPATLAPSLAIPGRLGMLYPMVAIVTGAGFLWLGFRFFKDRTRIAARRVFLSSIAHLPVLLMVMVADALVIRLLHL